LELAGLGNRILAAVVDSTLTVCAIVFLILIYSLTIYLFVHFSEPVSHWGIPFALLTFCLVISIFIIYYGYYLFFETIWRGQTPGKRLAGIRVVEVNGKPVSTGAVWIRNLLRMIDEGFLLIGLLFMLFDKNERRLGDLAANTVVIRERDSKLSDEELPFTAILGEQDYLDTGRITPQEYDLLLSFLRRRQHLSKNNRPKVAQELQCYFANKLAIANQQVDPELFLEKVLLSYRHRGEL
jgi:uncharacterized RDD family membrane protein YckC